MAKFLSVLGIVMGLLLAAVPSTLVAQELTLRVGLPDTLDTPDGKAIVEFKRLVEDGSKGRISVQLFPSSQLGSVIEQLQNVRDGAQDMVVASPGWFSQLFPKIDMLELPFLVTNWDEANKLLQSKTLPVLIAQGEQAVRIKVLGNLPYGFRHVTNRLRPVTSLADLQGLKLRVQNSPAHLAAFKALGVNPVAMAYGETYSAVQTGVVDGLEAPYTALRASKFPEVSKYISNTGHLFGMLMVFINADVYQKLGDEDRALLAQAMQAGEAVNMEAALAAQQTAVADLKAMGAEINDVPADVIAQMRAAVKSVYDEQSARLQPELDALLAEIGK